MLQIAKNISPITNKIHQKYYQDMTYFGNTIFLSFISTGTYLTLTLQSTVFIFLKGLGTYIRIAIVNLRMVQQFSVLLRYSGSKFCMDWLDRVTYGYRVWQALADDAGWGG